MRSGVQNFTMPKNSRQFIDDVVREKTEVVSTRFVHILTHILALDAFYNDNRPEMPM